MIFGTFLMLAHSNRQLSGIRITRDLFPVIDIRLDKSYIPVILFAEAFVKPTFNKKQKKIPKDLSSAAKLSFNSARLPAI